MGTQGGAGARVVIPRHGDRTKQLLKNSVYRALGETTSALGINGHHEPRSHPRTLP